MNQVYEWQRDDYTISTDPARLDLDLIAEFLQQRSYWARDRSRAEIERSISHSLVFGLYHPDENKDEQVGFARLVTDYSIFVYVCDVFVLESERGKGLGQWLMRTVQTHPELPSVRRWVLTTQDAHGMYAKTGFAPLKNPERWMQVGR
ncbi:MAG: GNAT family N-acetyltransferase [Acidobacteria bacterium]|nr:GNAT family N-acetyltransferase [Acidobacteriota bacterium]